MNQKQEKDIQEIVELKAMLEKEIQRNKSLELQHIQIENECIRAFLPKKSTFSLSYPIELLVHNECGTVASEKDLVNWFEENENDACPYCRRAIDNYRQAFTPYNFWTDDVIKKLIRHPDILVEFEYSSELLFNFFLEKKNSQTELLLQIAVAKVRAGEIDVLVDLIGFYVQVSILAKLNEDEDKEVYFQRLIRRFLNYDPLSPLAREELNKQDPEHVLKQIKIDVTLYQILDEQLPVADLVGDWYDVLDALSVLPKDSAITMILALYTGKNFDWTLFSSMRPSLLSDLYKNRQLSYIRFLHEHYQQWLVDGLSPTEDGNNPMHWVCSTSKDTKSSQELEYFFKIKPEFLFAKNKNDQDPVDMMIAAKKWHLLAVVLKMLGSKETLQHFKNDAQAACLKLSVALYHNGIKEGAQALKLWGETSGQASLVNFYDAILSRDLDKLKTVAIKEIRLERSQLKHLVEYCIRPDDQQLLMYLIKELPCSSRFMKLLWPLVFGNDDSALHQVYIAKYSQLIQSDKEFLKKPLPVPQLAEAINKQLLRNKTAALELILVLEKESDYFKLLDVLMLDLLTRHDVVTLVTLYINLYRNKQAKRYLDNFFKEKIAVEARYNSVFALDFCNQCYVQESRLLWDACLSNGFINEQTMDFWSLNRSEFDDGYQISSIQIEMLDRLIEIMALLNCPDLMGQLLLYACQGGVHSLVKKMLKSKSIRIYCDYDANHPAHFAAIHNWPDVLMHLVEQSFECVLFENTRQETALDGIIQNSHWDCIKPLRGCVAEESDQSKFLEVFLKAILHYCNKGLKSPELYEVLNDLEIFLNNNKAARTNECFKRLIQSIPQLELDTQEAFGLLSHPVIFRGFLEHFKELEPGDTKQGINSSNLLEQLNQSIHFLTTLSKTVAAKKLPFDPIHQCCTKMPRWQENPFIIKFIKSTGSHTDWPGDYSCLIPISPDTLCVDNFKNYMLQAMLRFYSLANEKKMRFRYELFETCVRFIDTTKEVKEKSYLCDLCLSQPMFKLNLGNRFFIEPDYVERLTRMKQDLLSVKTCHPEK